MPKKATTPRNIRPDEEKAAIVAEYFAAEGQIARRAVLAKWQIPVTADSLLYRWRQVLRARSNGHTPLKKKPAPRQARPPVDEPPTLPELVTGKRLSMQEELAMARHREALLRYVLKQLL